GPVEGGGTLRVPERVARAADRVEQPRLSALFELLAHVADVNGDHVVALGLACPNRLQQLFTRQHLARMAEEVLEQRELGVGQGQLPRATPRAACGRFEVEVRKTQTVGRTGAAE